MKRIAPLIAAAAAAGALALVVLAYQAVDDAGAQSGPVGTVAIDLDTTGNTGTSIGTGGPGIDPGDIQSSLGNVPQDGIATFDIVIDSATDGISA